MKVMKSYAVELLKPNRITQQPTEQLAIIVVDASDSRDALIQAVKTVALWFYENFKFNVRLKEMPETLHRYFNTEADYSTNFTSISYKVLN